MTKAVAIDLHMAWLFKGTDARKEHVPNSAEKSFLNKMPSWTELCLISPSGHVGLANSLHEFNHLQKYNLSIVPWSNLRRLSILWKLVIPLTQFINDIAPKLSSLQALRFRAKQPRVYHPGCEHDPPKFWERHLPASPQFNVDFSRMEELRELEIDGICNHFPIHDLLGPKLRGLRLHCEDDLLNVSSFVSQRSTKDILSAAKLSPDLERLELDSGCIDNLWHPTAIPGVDVDVGEYAFLNAICKFRRLRFLRLFPPFAAGPSRRSGPGYQGEERTILPVSDDQAVRIFDHLRTECPSLQILFIAAIPSLVNVDTMCWEVRQRGEQTILTTRHRNRNYEHRQIWIGQRKISGEIRRFTVPQVYMPDSEGWMLARNDLHDVGQWHQPRSY